MKSFKTFITEENYMVSENVRGQKGLDYETKIYKAIINADVDGLNPGDKPSAGFSNQGAGDIEAKYKGKDFNIEVKMSADDQMGGGSFTYDFKKKKFAPAKPIDPSDEELLLSAIEPQRKAIDEYILAARKLTPVEYHKNIDGIPIKVSKKGRDELKDRGLLKNINTKVVTDASFIAKHYNKKGVYYIQIGGAGLFYMGKNILNLPVPKLNGEIQIEIRLAYSGTKGKFPDGTETRTAGLRFQGRLIAKGKSPHSIDTVEGIKKLFNYQRVRTA
jgi:hypothetical protein